MNNHLAVNIGDTFKSPYGRTLGFADLVSLILSNAVAIAGFILFIFFVIGGISIITGAGQNNPEKVANGKQTLTAVVVGFIIVFISYWIITIVEMVFDLEILKPENMLNP